MMRQIPKKYVKLYAKAMKGKSRKTAMKVFCLECVGYDPKEVTQCGDIGCPLYPYRTKTKSTDYVCL